MEQIINFINKDGNHFYYMPVDENTANKFKRYLELCSSCEWVRIERTALHVELLELWSTQPTLLKEVPHDINVVGWPTITVIENSI